MNEKKSKPAIGLRAKLTGAILLSIFITVAAVNAGFAIVSFSSAREAAERVYENQSYSVADFIDKNIEDAHKELSAFSQIASIAGPATPEHERVAASRAAADSLGDNVSIKMTGLDGKELVLPGENEIDLSDRAYIKAALNGNTFVTSPFFSPVVNRMVLVIAQPLTWENEIIGAIFMLLPGDFINDAIEAVKAGYSGYACAFDSTGALISHKDIIGILERNQNRYIEMAKSDTSYEGMAEAVSVMMNQKNGTLRFTNNDKEKMLGGFSSTSLGWTVLVCSTIADVRADANRAIIMAIAISAVCVIFVVLFALSFARTISRPIVALSDYMRKAGGEGKVILTPEEDRLLASFIHERDEIGRMMLNVGSFVDHIINTARELETIAEGDLTVDLEMLSDADTLGKSVKHVVDSLNRIFSEINSSSTQVSHGSKQIADGAQALAQGSAQQAASIEELSSTIAEIAGKTKENAATTEKTVRLSAAIKENAEKGSRQMDEMIAAVQEINDASQSISKIIKTIDDIAFQTNILALNAAVEAARAGQHGKGFAVVAEEVRNLASKSAEAAKETGAMIQNSMEKAMLGSRIAGETAASLTDIVDGVNESTLLIAEIANASEQQTMSIAHINTGIGQVAQVVQQNSATAQESAAASEEMSGQSETLRQLIARFKLKDDRPLSYLPTRKNN